MSILIDISVARCFKAPRRTTDSWAAHPRCHLPALRERLQRDRRSPVAARGVHRVPRVADHLARVERREQRVCVHYIGCDISLIMSKIYGREGLTAPNAKEERNVEEGVARADDLEQPIIKITDGRGAGQTRAPK